MNDLATFPLNVTFWRYTQYFQSSGIENQRTDSPESRLEGNGL